MSVTLTAVLGYVAAGGMGLTLGLLGGGGGVLTVPILVYLFGVGEMTATGYSMAVVGAVAAAGAATYLRRGQVSGRAVLWFGLPSLAGVAACRQFVLPNLPEAIAAGPLRLERGTLIMLTLAGIMVLAGLSMVRRRSPDAAGAEPSGPAWAAGQGLLVGLVTGFVGAGGGFLIVPALVILLGLPMRPAVGTSLVIIALNCAAGVLGDAARGRAMDWAFLARFTAAAASGMMIGLRLNRRVTADRLKPLFGWFVLAVGAAVAVKELWQ